MGGHALLLAAALGVCSLKPSRVDAALTIFYPDPGTLHDSGQEADRQLDLMKKLGADVVKLSPSLENPELGRLDNLVSSAQRRGMDVLLTPVGPAAPIVAWLDGRPVLGQPSTRPTMAEYVGFVGELGRRYPSVHRWSIWNEPNQPGLFPMPDGGGKTQGRTYRGLFIAAQAALQQSGHAPTEVLIGETSPGLRLPFLRQALCLNRRWRLREGCAPIVAGGWAHHPYINARRPWYRSEGMGTADLPRLNRALRRAAQAGATQGRLPVYVTEFGVKGDGRRAGEMLSAAEWAMTRFRWVRSFAQYSIRDDWWGTGLLRSDGSPKPALIGFTHSTFVIRRGRRAFVWGHLRNSAGTTTVSLIDGGRVTDRIPVTTDRHGYFKLSTRWRRHRRWCVAGGLPVRSFNLRRPSRVRVTLEAGRVSQAPSSSGASDSDSAAACATDWALAAAAQAALGPPATAP